MLAIVFKIDQKKKNFAFQIKFQKFIDAELTSFQKIQKTLFKPSFLIYFDEKLIFYVNLDVNRLEFDIMIYHLIEIMKIEEFYLCRF